MVPIGMRYLTSPDVHNQHPACRRKSLNPLDCGFHVALNARSLTKYMLDRDEGAPVANLKDDWQPPPSALPEVRQYRKQLVQHITALTYGVGGGTGTYTERSFIK
jgi:hypothetical protein